MKVKERGMGDDMRGYSLALHRTEFKDSFCFVLIDPAYQTKYAMIECCTSCRRLVLIPRVFGDMLLGSIPPEGRLRSQMRTSDKHLPGT